MGTEWEAAAKSRAEAHARVKLAMAKKEKEADLLRTKAASQKAIARAEMERDLPKVVAVEKLQSFSLYAWGAGIVGALGVAAIVGVNIMNDIISNERSENADETTTERTAPVADLSSIGVDPMLVETGSSDGSFFMIAMGGLVAIIVGVITVFKIRTADSDSDSESEEVTENKTVTSYQSQWDSLSTRRNDLMVQWSRYETDVALMIDYPIMTDYTDPVIAKVITAMQEMRSAELLAVDEVTTPVYGSKMLSAVNKFEAALTAAEKYARRYGQTKLDPREQRKLSAARQALNIILDEEAPAHEVEAAYKSLRSSLSGIIDLPQQAVHVLEAKVRRELTVA